MGYILNDRIKRTKHAEHKCNHTKSLAVDQSKHLKSFLIWRHPSAGGLIISLIVLIPPFVLGTLRAREIP